MSTQVFPVCHQNKHYFRLMDLVLVIFSKCLFCGPGQQKQFRRWNYTKSAIDCRCPGNNVVFIQAISCALHPQGRTPLSLRMHFHFTVSSGLCCSEKPTKCWLISADIVKGVFSVQLSGWNQAETTCSYPLFPQSENIM